ncbi:hypothetical protein [Tenacibaculum soleae]|uniref:Uncharacterized protein n=1 Tax=Tenacibaculum soleae TaxID=447689 RepID=A0A1B9Y1Q8_9FLAO|nr:hypothetical protein [Tenacibaculum soleae]MDO6811783.1 hypothetical protein [Tenacibaculum soleae]OCK43651.1 hypothetical protein BA195_02810 [Tenacibaculum soleae]
MQITNEQIQQIDNRLKKRGIKYWDLRIEMVDHIVSNMESNATTNDFKVELEKSLRKLNWNGGLFGVNTLGWQNANRKYRKEYFTEITAVFKSFKNITIYVLFSILLYIISNFIAFNIFELISLGLLISPMLFFFFVTAKQLFKKYGRSVNLDYGVSYFSFAFLMMMLPIQFLKDLSTEIRITAFIVFIPILFVTTYAGYKTYKKALTRVENMKKELSL